MSISYFGGKQKMSEWIFPFIPRNIKTYIEPFSGGFWVYMNTNGDYSHVNTIVYNDINKHMVNLFACLKDYDTFLKEFKNEFSKGGILYQDGNIEEYKEKMKNLYYFYKKDFSDNNFLDNPPTQTPDFKSGVIYAFLITSAFNACWPRSAGASCFSKDKLKLNALLNKLNDPKYQKKYNNITYIENMDFEDFIKKYDSPETYIYLDPPYNSDDDRRLDWYGVGKDNIFGRNSHKRLCDLLKTTKSKWALSYYDFDELSEWLPKDEYRWEKRNYFRSSASFSDTKEIEGTEVLIMNYNMTEEEYKENAKYFKSPKSKNNNTPPTELKPVKSNPKKKLDDVLLDKVIDQIRLDIDLDDVNELKILLNNIKKPLLDNYIPKDEVIEEVIEEYTINCKEECSEYTSEYNHICDNCNVETNFKNFKKKEEPKDSGLYEASGLKDIFEPSEKSDDFWD